MPIKRVFQKLNPKIKKEYLKVKDEILDLTAGIIILFFGLYKPFIVLVLLS